MLALHIPDGFLPPSLSLAGWLLALPALLWALHHTQKHLEDRTLPRMGLLACFVLVAQGLQVPLPGGTSAHLQGSALTALALGAAPSIVVLTAVIAIQALVLGDGGLLTMGWNLVNMALLGAFSASLLRRWPFVAAFVSVQISTLATSLELAAAGTSPLHVALWMLAPQALVGLGEAVVTVAALRVIRRV